MATTELRERVEAVAGGPLTEPEFGLLRAWTSGHLGENDGEEVRGPVLAALITVVASARSSEGSGELLLDGGRVVGPVEIVASRIDRPVRFRDVSFDGPVRLRRSVVADVRFEVCSGRSIEITACRVRGDVLVHGRDDRPCFFEDVDLSLSAISGSVEVMNTALRRRDEHSEADGELRLANSHIDGGLILADDTQVDGGVQAKLARFGSDVFAMDVILGSDGCTSALDLTRARIDGSLFFHPEDLDDTDGAIDGIASATGTVSLSHSDIVGDVVMSRAMMSVERGLAVEAIDAAIGGSVWLNHASLRGALDLSTATIGGNLELEETMISHPPQPETPSATEMRGQTAPGDGRKEPRPPRPLIRLVATSVGHSLIWDPYLPQDAHVDLSTASAGVFEYSSDLAWADRADLRGFRYRTIRSGWVPYRWPRIKALAERIGLRSSRRSDDTDDTDDTRMVDRLFSAAFATDESHLSWLRAGSSNEVDRASYRHLASVLHSQGHQRDAERVAMAAVNDSNRERGTLHVLLGLPFRLFTGNGYRASRALVWAILLIAVGAVVYGAQIDHFAPTDGDSVSNPTGSDPRALVYSADTLLPIIDLGEADAFAVRSTSPDWIEWVRWLQILAGFAIAGALGATLARFTNRSIE